MGKKELMAKISAKVQEVKNLVAQDKLEDAKAAKAELDTLQGKYDLIKDLEGDETGNAENGSKPVKPIDPKDSIKEFAQAARLGFPKNSMREGNNADGGYTVPEDIQTKIEKYRDNKRSLRSLVRVTPVKTYKGSQTFKKRSQQTGFSKVGEGGKIGKKETPKFERKDWTIDKYAGYFPVTNEVLEDTDENLTATLIEWIGDESRITDNNIILGAIKKKKITELTGLDDIKKALNVTLGAAFKATSKIITNDDGLQYLDTLKDSQGRDLLKTDPVETLKLVLCAGATRVPVEVFPNNDMPSDITTTGKRKIPFVIGDLHEYFDLKDRKQITITNSDIAVIGELNAFEEDLTIWRAIEREGEMIRDDQAIVNGQITIDDDTISGE